jgi:hypothetical protein
MAIWYILWQFGIFSHVLVFWTKKKLATMIGCVTKVSASFFKDVNEMVETNWRGGVSKED